MICPPEITSVDICPVCVRVSFMGGLGIESGTWADVCDCDFQTEVSATGQMSGGKCHVALFVCPTRVESSWRK